MNNKKIGNNGENLAAVTLISLGIECVAKIATPHRRIKNPPYIVYDEKVAGDHHGILPNGIGVLAESKTISGDRLNYSELMTHQHAELEAWSGHNGLALVVWVSDYGVFVMEYILLVQNGFKPRTSLSVETAKCVDTLTRRGIQNMMSILKGLPEK